MSCSGDAFRCNTARVSTHIRRDKRFDVASRADVSAAARKLVVSSNRMNFRRIFAAQQNLIKIVLIQSFMSDAEKFGSRQIFRLQSDDWRRGNARFVMAAT
jgi:hypothetical protein